MARRLHSVIARPRRHPHSSSRKKTSLQASLRQKPVRLIAAEAEKQPERHLAGRSTPNRLQAANTSMMQSCNVWYCIALNRT